MEIQEEQYPDLLQLLGTVTPLSADFQQRIQDQLLTEKLPGRHLLLRPGETSRRIYFIRKGLLRSYGIDRNGKQSTNWFISQGELMISVCSFFNQKPAEEYIEVLSEATLQSLSWNQLNSFYADFPESNLIGRILIQKYYTLSEQRSTLMRTYNPLERYHALLEQHPKIEQQTTQTNIATYLGLSRETLSRMKTRLLRNRQAANSLGHPTTTNPWAGS